MKIINNLAKDDQNKLKLFKRLGYDILKARHQIVAKANLSGRILEIGTGRGHMAVVLARKGLKLVSIDLDRKSQNVARVNLKALKLEKSVKMKIMNAERLKFPDDSFDSVISVNFLHHARNPLRCVKEMARVSRCRLVLSDLNKNGTRIMNQVHALEGKTHSQTKISFKTLKTLLENLGFRIKNYRNKCETVLVAIKTTKRMV